MILPPVYPILDTATAARCACSLRDAAEALVAGGARLLQFRHKQQWTREIFAEAAWVRDLCREVECTLVINDRGDYAALLGAGLHVGQTDLLPALARKLIGHAALGLSTHNAPQLAQAGQEPVDYVALGPIFATQSKEQPDPVVGVEGLRAWRHLASQPLVAIGGITQQTAPAVWEAGAASVAIIGDLLPAGAAADEIKERMKAWRQLARETRPAS
jgi:thiamine-phosphate pyrophosphorylase